MYRDLGFIRVSGQLARNRRGSETRGWDDDASDGAALDGGTPAGALFDDGSRDDGPRDDGRGNQAEPDDRLDETTRSNGRADPGASPNQPDDSPEPAPYAYLIYPHKPIVAYVPKTGRLLSEYCVEFPDLTGAISQSRLPDSDDVLAKWMALTGDEERLIRNANMHLPGRQVDPGRIRRDLWRLSEWERQRRGYGPVRAPRT